jgi:hypothetical protein
MFWGPYYIELLFSYFTFKSISKGSVQESSVCLGVSVLVGAVLCLLVCP